LEEIDIFEVNVDLKWVHIDTDILPDKQGHHPCIVPHLDIDAARQDKVGGLDVLVTPVISFLELFDFGNHGGCYLVIHDLILNTQISDLYTYVLLR
jgi:hypothetical protein